MGHARGWTRTYNLEYKFHKITWNLPLTMTIFLYQSPIYLWAWPFLNLNHQFTIEHDHFSISITNLPLNMTIFQSQSPIYLWAWPFSPGDAWQQHAPQSSGRSCLLWWICRSLLALSVQYGGSDPEPAGQPGGSGNGVINTLRLRQNGRHFPDDFFNAFSWMKMYWKFDFDENFTEVYSQGSN